jgi:8-oxo-dGTP pyrophosphatase MutT (NUDIX family)
MAGTISFSEARKRKPDFKGGWILTVIHPDGSEQQFGENDWKIESRFGSVHRVVVTDQDGQPLFDRPDYAEAPNVNMIVWGRERDGEIKLAVITEERPHADNPEDPTDTKPLIFGQVPMGFVDRVFNADDFRRYEDLLQGAIRESQEETGASTVLNRTQPKYPYLFPSPSFTRTSSRLYFLEVDLELIRERAKIYGEKIYNAEFIGVPELLARIRAGIEQDDDKKIIYRYGNSLALYMIFFAHHPELFKF